MTADRGALKGRNPLQARAVRGSGVSRLWSVGFGTFRAERHVSRTITLTVGSEAISCVFVLTVGLQIETVVCFVSFLFCACDLYSEKV